MTTRLSYFDASNNYKQPGKFIRSTTEGATAYQEAIDFLNAFEELSVDLILEEGMSNSCKDHTDDTGNSQVIGNIGRDDSTPADRVDRYGLAEGVE
jgi:hypothetical protein